MSDLLARVVRATAGAADSDALLDRAAAVLVTDVDWVLLDRLDEPDLVTRVVARTVDGRLPLPPGHDGPSARRSSAGTGGLLPVLDAAPQRLLRLDAAALRRLAEDPEPHLARQARSALALGTGDLLLLGLTARDRLLGVLTVGARSRVSPALVRDLTDVALHLGAALDAARLLASQRAVATAMQTSLLPPVPQVPGLRLAARYLPAARELEVGGDWYDAFPVDDGLVVVVGDVRGHDVAAAAQMADLRNLLRAHAVDRDEPPSALLSRLERTAERLGLEVSATCVVGRLRRVGRTWELVWSSAGHLPPVLAGAEGAVLLETEADLMLGVQTGSPRADQRTVLRPGEAVVLCTDGLVEERGTALADRLEALRGACAAGGGEEPDALAERLLALAPHPEDDVALLVVRVDG